MKTEDAINIRCVSPISDQRQTSPCGVTTHTGLGFRGSRPQGCVPLDERTEKKKNPSTFYQERRCNPHSVSLKKIAASYERRTSWSGSRPRRVATEWGSRPQASGDSEWTRRHLASALSGFYPIVRQRHPIALAERLI